MLVVNEFSLCKGVDKNSSLRYTITDMSCIIHTYTE